MWDSSHTYTHHAINQIGASHYQIIRIIIILLSLLESTKYTLIQFIDVIPKLFLPSLLNSTIDSLLWNSNYLSLCLYSGFMVSTLLSLGFFSPIKQSNPLIKSNQTIYIKEFNLKMNQTFLEDKTCKPCQTLSRRLGGQRLA